MCLSKLFDAFLKDIESKHLKGQLWPRVRNVFAYSCPAPPPLHLSSILPLVSQSREGLWVPEVRHTIYSMESLGRFWYYLKATQGPHCCMFNFRTAENSSRGRDIWREVLEMYILAHDRYQLTNIAGLLQNETKKHYLREMDILKTCKGRECNNVRALKYTFPTSNKFCFFSHQSISRLGTYQ